MNKYQSAKVDVDLDPPTDAVNDIYVEPDDTHNSAFEPDVELDPPPSVADPGQNSRLWQRRAWLLVLGVITLAIATVFGWRWWQFQHTHVSTDNAQIQGHVSPIAAKISATVQKVQVKDGDYVKAGQPLIILEDQDLNLKVQQAEANLAAAKAQLQSAADTEPLTSQTNTAQIQQAQANLAASESAVSAAKAEVSQAQALVDTNRAKVAQAQTEVNKTQADFRRYETLYAQGAIAAQQRDTTRAAWENAQANLTAAKQTVAQAQAQVNNAHAQLQKALAQAEAARGQVAETRVSGQKVVVQKSQTKQAQAQVAQAAAALALARQQIKYTVIQAPLSGYVGKLTAQVGQKVESGQPILSIVPLDTEQIYVDANFKETTLKNLYIGEPAEIEVDAYPGEVFRATVAGISPATGSSFALLAPDNATGNFNKVVQWLPVRLTFNPDADPQHKLRAGLSVKVTVNTIPAKYGYKH
ncbi:secretion protein HlyD [Nostoc sp. T09]|uniref:HlyD family secretion protein n=1 Tax=Nostoc sp. T09 TaxID=1932621 RepID=UPI000A3C2F4D|nr:HlyD family secretion protein [Nostoc sp. T09]OUL18163.1 secretion protein HlyD [Nostoc sp. T09]